MPVSRWIRPSIVLVSLTLAGCDSTALHTSGTTRVVALGDFSDPTMRGLPGPSASDVDTALIEAGLSPAQPPEVLTPGQSGENAFFDVRALPGEPVVIDSLIGQVNGRPIYADEVLGPVADQLRAEYERLSWQEFRPMLEQLVMQRLQEVVLNELFLAEARASLTQQQQQGLLAWMQQLEQDVVGRSGGVQSRAEQEVLAEEGRTLEEYLRLEEERVLIQQLMNDRVRHKAVVSWHDIERAYAARINEFQPPAQVVIGRIRLRTTDEAGVQQVQASLDAGEPFAEVATQAGMADGGVWQRFDLPQAGIAGLEINEAYKPLLEGLAQGEVSAPLQRGSFTMWFAMLERTQVAPRSLYDEDVQRQLQMELFNQAVSEAQAQFVQDVLQRGIYDELELMHNRTITIALTRFPAR